LANFDFDQAEGLRRMLAGPKPRIVSFLSACPQDDKGAMLVNLGASLARAGNDVIIVDACEHEYGVTLVPWDQLPKASAMVAAVSHREYADMGVARLADRVVAGGLFADVKAAHRPDEVRASGLRLWRL